MRSDTIKKGFERAPHRSLLRATGSIESESDWDKPFIAICNSYTDCIPGHAHLNEVGMLVKRLVREAGVGLAPGSAFGAESAGWLRWCFASRDPQRLVQGVERLRAWLARAPGASTGL